MRSLGSTAESRRPATLKSTSSSSQESVLPEADTDTPANFAAAARRNAGMRATGNAKRIPLDSSTTTRPFARSNRAVRARCPRRRATCSRARACGICARISASLNRPLAMIPPPRSLELRDMCLDQPNGRDHVCRTHAVYGANRDEALGTWKQDHCFPIALRHVDVRRRVLSWGQEDTHPEAPGLQNRRHMGTLNPSAGFRQPRGRARRARATRRRAFCCSPTMHREGGARAGC